MFLYQHVLIKMNYFLIEDFGANSRQNKSPETAERKTKSMSKYLTEKGK